MSRMLVYVACLFAACSGSQRGQDDGGQEPDGCVNDPPQEVECIPGQCPQLSITGDPYASTPGSFKGYSDPHLLADPDVADRVWLSYSWLEVGPLTDPGGAQVWVAIVTNHLARSDDGGATFSFVSELWPSIPTEDPEGSGEAGLIDSETASLAWMKDAQGNVTWYGAHLRYFLRPMQGYHPKFATSYTVRVTAAASPEELDDAPEAVLGVSATAPVYDAGVSLDELVGLPLADCAMANNPSLFAREQTLYLVFECLAFEGTQFSPDRTTIQLIATEPSGAPASWSWRHVGVIADDATWRALGVEVLQQPDIALGTDGALLLTVTPARENPDGVESIHEGMLALELASLEPPALARGCDGKLRLRARMQSESLGGCSYASASDTGVLCHSVQTETEPRHLYITGAHP